MSSDGLERIRRRSVSESVGFPLDGRRYDAAAAVVGMERGLGVRLRITHAADKGVGTVEAVDEGSRPALDILPQVMDRVGQLRVALLRQDLPPVAIGWTLVEHAATVSQDLVEKEIE